MKQQITSISFAMVCIMSLGSFTVKGQTTLYSNNFDNAGSGPALPSGWTTNTMDSTWILTNSRASGDTLSKSSKNDALDIECASAHFNKNAIATLAGFSTIGYKNITILWSERYAPKYLSGGNTLTVEYSIDGGTTWNAIAAPGNASGYFYWVNSGTPIVLPAGAAGISNLMFRWVAYVHATNGNYQFDDLNISGTSSSGIVENLMPSGFISGYSNQKFHFSFSNETEGHGEISLFSTSGQLVYKGIYNQADNIIDVSNLKPGLYVANISDGYKMHTAKFVK